MKTSVVKSVSKASEFQSQHGTLYNYNYVLEDGAQGQMAHKTDAARFPLGTEVEYETYMKGEYQKIKLDTPGGSQKKSYSKYDPETQVQIIRQNCVGNALRHFELNGHKAKKEEVVQLAEYFKNYVENGLTGSAIPKKEQEQKEPDLNELPFDID